MEDEGDIQKAFARIFGTVGGKLVLADLERESGLCDAVFPPGNLDGTALAIRAAQKDGMRLLSGYIRNMILEGEELLRTESDEAPPQPGEEVIKP